MMQIGELAQQGGVTVQTIRFYERRGLMPEPQRRESGYRVYANDDVKRLQFICQAKVLGFSLDEIRNILRMRRRGQCPCGEVISLAERHLSDVESQIRQLTKFQSELHRAVRQWKKSGQQKLSANAICVLIERTMTDQPREKKRE